MDVDRTKRRVAAKTPVSCSILSPQRVDCGGHHLDRPTELLVLRVDLLRADHQTRPRRRVGLDLGDERVKPVLGDDALELFAPVERHRDVVDDDVEGGFGDLF